MLNVVKSYVPPAIVVLVVALYAPFDPLPKSKQDDCAMPDTEKKASEAISICFIMSCWFADQI
jgi:hypothetical protein